MNKIKQTAHIINNESLTHSEKLHELNLIFDRLYMDGYNAGCEDKPVTEQEQRVARLKEQVAV